MSKVAGVEAQRKKLGQSEYSGTHHMAMRKAKEEDRADAGPKKVVRGDPATAAQVDEFTTKCAGCCDGDDPEEDSSCCIIL